MLDVCHRLPTTAAVVRLGSEGVGSVVPDGPVPVVIAPALRVERDWWLSGLDSAEEIEPG